MCLNRFLWSEGDSMLFWGSESSLFFPCEAATEVDPEEDPIPLRGPAAPLYSREKSRCFRCCVVPGNMAANIRGRPIRSLRMRGKPVKLDSEITPWALCFTNKVGPARNNPGTAPHPVCYVWQVGMTAGKRTYRWIWPEVSRGFFTSPWKRLLFKMDGEPFYQR